MTEREAYIAFSVFPGIGPYRFKLLLDYFGFAAKAWLADRQTLINIGLGEKLTGKLCDFRKDFHPEIYEKSLLQNEIRIITRIDKEFPPQLQQIPDPPIALYVKGQMPKIWNRTIAIVGTRKPTFYGKNITEKLASQLAQQNIIIVSGMARGVDVLAHRSALTNQATTVAVLGCGVDIVYPPEHKNLYSEIIAKGGAILSEVPPGHTVLKGLFPMRNRIISGLSQGILVTEGAEDSGSLITARFAAEQGREVFAVPGPITSYLSDGPSKLIKNGAKLVTDVYDILEELALSQIPVMMQNKRKIMGQNLQEQKIIDLLSQGELYFDEIVKLSNISASDLGAVLSVLEINNLIINMGNGKYSLK